MHTFVAVSDVLFGTAIASTSMTFDFDQDTCCHILPRFQEHHQIRPWMHAMIPELDLIKTRMFLFLTILAASRYNSSVSSLVPSSVALAASKYASDKARKPRKIALVKCHRLLLSLFACTINIPDA